MHNHSDTVGISAVRRFEVISGTGRRRRFSADQKAAIVEESGAPGVTVSEVARRHGLAVSQLFAWRRQHLGPATQMPAFVPAVIAPVAGERGSDGPPIAVELEMGGALVRITHDADAGVIAAVIAALKSAR